MFKELKKFLKDQIKFCETNSVGDTSAYKHTLLYIKNELEPKYDWIPVEQKMPEDEYVVLVVCEFESGGSFVDESRYNSKIGAWMKTERFYEAERVKHPRKITHWQYFPETPKND